MAAQPLQDPTGASMAELQTPAASAPHPPHSKRVIPIEIWAHIVDHLSGNDIAAFALASRQFFALASGKARAELVLDLPPHWGEYPLIQPFPRGTEEHIQWTMGEMERTEMRCRARLREKIRRLTLQLGKAGPGGVRKVSVVLRKDTLYNMISFLDIVSPSLEILELNGPTGHAWADWGPLQGDFFCLDFALVAAPPHFPALTHLTLNRGALDHVETVHMLCIMAPSLICLEAAVGHLMTYPNWQGAEASTPHLQIPDIPFLSSTTKLQQLRVDLTDVILARSHPFYDDAIKCHPIIDLIALSPELRQVSIQYPKDGVHLGQYIGQPLMNALSALSLLEDLHWPRGLEFFEAIPQSDTQSFPSLRRLVLECVGYMTLFKRLPPLPVLEIIHLVDSADHRGWIPNALDLPLNPAPTLLQGFARTIRSSPRLHTIHNAKRAEVGHDLGTFDRLEQVWRPDKLLVRSLVRGEVEIVHVAYLPRMTGRTWAGYTHVGRRKTVVFSTPIRGRGPHEAVYHYSPDGAEWHMVDWDGVDVPHTVLEDLVRVQENMREWRRGIEIGDEAWEMLKAWRDATGPQAEEAS